MKPIVAILSQREGFSPTHFGAVALCLRDFTLASRYRQDTHVFGVFPAPGFAGIHYHQLFPRQHWYETRNKSYARSCAAEIQRLQAGLVEIHNRPVLARYLSRWLDVPVALHLHNDPQEMKAAATPRERRWLLEHCAAIYCVSTFLRDRFLEGIDSHHEKVHVVYNGLAVSPLPTHKQNQFLYVGRLTENKGGLLFAEALEKALPQLPGWRGVMAGGRRHSPSVQLSDYEKSVGVIMDRLGDRAVFEGFVSHEQAMQLFAESAIAVVPSLWDEPFGRTALEAMTQGCPTITSGFGGLREVVGDAAVIPSPFTAETLAAAMVQLAQDKAQQHSLQQRGLAQAQHFDIAKMTQTLDAIRASLLQ